MKYFSLLLLIGLLVSCNNKPSIINKYLNPGKLSSQKLTININTDTTVVLLNGTKLIIPRGSLKTKNGKPAKLEVKEALTMPQIMLAGLSTESNEQPLRSGGMLYVNAQEGEDIKIDSPLTAKLPTLVADTSMQLYKGEEENGKINWVDPQPLKTEENPELAIGEKLFKANCASCHHPTKRLTGPSLAGADKRIGDMYKLYDWVHNPAKAAKHSPYFCNLIREYGTLMTPFPTLSENDIDAIVYYVNKQAVENNYKPEIEPEFNYDSCEYYQKQYASLSEAKDSIESNRKQFVEVRQFTTDIPIGSGKVAPIPYKADYYSIEIDAFGRYNVDQILDEGFPESELMVNLSGFHEKKNQVFLVIPSINLFVQGGYLDDNKTYGFYELDGKIPLPQNTEAYVFAIGESRDSAQLYFGSKKFITQLRQSVEIDLNKITEDELTKAITAFNFQNLSTKIQKDSTKYDLNKVEAELEKIRMKKIKCECGSLDTMRNDIVYDWFDVPAR